jgi:hypothetical protein
MSSHDHDDTKMQEASAEEPTNIGDNLKPQEESKDGKRSCRVKKPATSEVKPVVKAKEG